MDCNVSSTCFTDAPPNFSELTADFPWLATLETRARNATFATVEDLHRAFFFIHVAVWTHLPQVDQQIIADSHLCRLLDDAAEVHWTTTFPLED